MKKEEEEKGSFLMPVMLCFTVMLLSIAFMGSFIPGMSESGSSFYLEGGGIPYPVIFETFLLGVVCSGVKGILFSSKCFQKMLTLWKLVLMYFSILGITTIFILIFGWFPADELSAWIVFVIMMTISFLGSVTFMYWKMNQKTKEYDRLLKAYQGEKQKENQKEEEYHS